MRLPDFVIEAFNDSLDQCVGDPTFLDRFYDRFIASSPDLPAFFADTAMDRQKRALKASLYTALMVADGNRAATAHLRTLGELHRNLGIDERHYQLWLDSLTATVAETEAVGQDAAVEESWKQVLECSIRIMIGNG